MKKFYSSESYLDDKEIFIDIVKNTQEKNLAKSIEMLSNAKGVKSIAEKILFEKTESYNWYDFKEKFEKYKKTEKEEIKKFLLKALNEGEFLKIKKEKVELISKKELLQIIGSMITLQKSYSNFTPELRLLENKCDRFFFSEKNNISILGGNSIKLHLEIDSYHNTITIQFGYFDIQKEYKAKAKKEEILNLVVETINEINKENDFFELIFSTN